MWLDLTADQKLLRSATADFLGDTSGISVSRAMNAAVKSVDRDTWRRGAELGWTSLLVPEDLGGGSASGDGLADATVIAGEFGRLAAAGPFLPCNVVALALAEAARADAPASGGATRAGTAHSGPLKQLLAGEAIATWACCPPGGAWDPSAGAVIAVPDADGYLISGVHDGVEAAGDADYLLVLASTPSGPAQFLVPASADGLSIAPLGTLDLTRDFGRVTYDRVRVGPDAVVGGPGDATRAAVERQFQVAVVLQCAELAGVVDAVLAMTRQWLADRYTFGRPLESYQALKHRFADLTTWSHAIAAAACAAATAVGERRPDAAETVSVAKSYVGQRATDIVQDCVQLHGGLGVTWEHDIHVYLRRATLGRVTWGTPSEHRRRIAGFLGVGGVGTEKRDTVSRGAGDHQEERA